MENQDKNEKIQMKTCKELCTVMKTEGTMRIIKHLQVEDEENVEALAISLQNQFPQNNRSMKSFVDSRPTQTSYAGNK